MISETAERAATPGGTSAYSRTVSYQYDANSNRTRITWPDGVYVTYDYDALDRMTYVRAGGTQILGRYYWEQYTGRLASRYLGGDGWSNSTTSVQATRYWDDDGDLNRLWLRSRDNGVTNRNFYYGYDGSARLISADATDDAWLWRPGGAETVSYGTANALDQYLTVGGVALTYDARGNRSDFDGLATAHDSDNRLIAASVGSMSVAYHYDADGRRVEKDFFSGGADVTFLHAGG